MTSHQRPLMDKKHTVVKPEHASKTGSPVRQVVPRTEFRTVLQAAGNQAMTRLLAPGNAGKPLNARTLAVMEHRFGQRFSDVRIHTDAATARDAHDLHARAFTVGSDIGLASGEYDGGSGPSHRLLAHELAHVVQQRRGGPPPPLDPSAAHEQAANAAAIATGPGPVPVGGATGIGIARDGPMTGSHAGGALGEVDLAFALGEKGFQFAIVGGPGGHQLTSSGYDAVAFNPKSGELWIIDNKASGRTGTIGSASAITTNLRKNLTDAIDFVTKMKDMPNRILILGRLKAAAKALDAGQPLPTNVKIKVTNAGGYLKGTGGKLAANPSVQFEDITGQAVRDARDRDIAKAKAAGVKTSRPRSHASTAARRQQVEAADAAAIAAQEKVQQQAAVKSAGAKPTTSTPAPTAVAAPPITKASPPATTGTPPAAKAQTETPPPTQAAKPAPVSATKPAAVAPKVLPPKNVAPRGGASRGMIRSVGGSAAMLGLGLLQGWLMGKLHQSLFESDMKKLEPSIQAGIAGHGMDVAEVQLRNPRAPVFANITIETTFHHHREREPGGVVEFTMYAGTKLVSVRVGGDNIEQSSKSSNWIGFHTLEIIDQVHTYSVQLEPLTTDDLRSYLEGRIAEIEEQAMIQSKSDKETESDRQTRDDLLWQLRALEAAP